MLDRLSKQLPHPPFGSSSIMASGSQLLQSFTDSASASGARTVWLLLNTHSTCVRGEAAGDVESPGGSPHGRVPTTGCHSRRTNSATPAKPPDQQPCVNLVTGQSPAMIASTHLAVNCHSGQRAVRVGQVGGGGPAPRPATVARAAHVGLAWRGAGGEGAWPGGLVEPPSWSNAQGRWGHRLGHNCHRRL